MRTSQKKIRRILLLFICLMLILMIFFGIVKNHINNRNNSNDNNSNNEDDTTYNKSTHYNDEIISFSNYASDVYKGSKPAYEISDFISSTFESYLPSISVDIKNKTNVELADYFNKEEEMIYLNLGITNQEKFINFVEKLQNIDLDSYELVTFIEDSYKKDGDKEVISFKVKYESGKEITCKAHITNIIEFEII